MLEDPDKPLTAEDEQLIFDQLAIPGAPLDEAQGRAQITPKANALVNQVLEVWGENSDALVHDIWI